MIYSRLAERCIGSGWLSYDPSSPLGNGSSFKRRRRDFNGRRIRQLPSGEFMIDMQKFIEERLHGVDIPKGSFAEEGTRYGRGGRPGAGELRGAQLVSERGPSGRSRAVKRAGQPAQSADSGGLGGDQRGGEAP